VAEGKYLTREGVREPEHIFKREVEQNLWIKDHLSVGRQVGPYYLTSEYSHHSRHCGGEGLLLVGDAFAFLDPVFSSGVFLALRSGELAADAVDAALTAGDVSAARFAEYGAEIRRGLEAMRKLVYAFYDHEFSFRTFLKAYPQMKGDLTDCLIGNLFRDFDPMWEALGDFARLPQAAVKG